MPTFERLFDLIAQTLGAPAAHWLQAHVEVPPGLSAFAWTDETLHRAWLAEALNLCLLHKLVEAVPVARTYVQEQAAAGRRVLFDHGALRTVDWPDNGALPRGRLAFSRLLEPLGFTDVRTYPLTKLNMTGWAYRQQDLPEGIAQFFVSELHPGRFSEAFQAAVSRSIGTSRDPLQSEQLLLLEQLRITRHCPPAAARNLLPALCQAFDCQHGPVAEQDYRLLLGESAEMAWIATEGNRFNHLTDRVADLQAVVAAQQALDRPLKAQIEVSASGRVRQTALKAVSVQRPLLDAEGQAQLYRVPGSFIEFIQREIDPDSNRLDLNFDSGNAQGIFKMTDAR